MLDRNAKAAAAHRQRRQRVLDEAAAAAGHSARSDAFLDGPETAPFERAKLVPPPGTPRELRSVLHPRTFARAANQRLYALEH